ncbi:MAG: hypothetical protein KBD37_07290 [Burkholderiales bacterium]|nr:hypothetical protein [Burkholderiales bacterium]
MSIILHFDVLDYVEQAEKLGVPQALAKFQARKLEETIETISEQTNKAIEAAATTIKADIKDRDLATKGDIRESELRLQKGLETNKLELQKGIETTKLELQKEIREVESRLLKWQMGIGITSIIVLCGAMFTMLKSMLHV